MAPGPAQSGLGALQGRMIGHGMLLLLTGLLAGVGLLVSLIGGLEYWPGQLFTLQLPGNSAAWVRIHIGSMLNAFLIVLVALVLPILRFPPAAARRIAILVAATGWANAVFYWAALFAPNRALTFGGNRLGEANLASVLGLVPALLFAVVSIAVVFVLARQAFRAAAATSQGVSDR